MKLVDLLPLADIHFFPNTNAVLRIILTIPVGSVPCEHSFFGLRCFKDWSRSSMTEDRPNGLALHYRTLDNKGSTVSINTHNHIVI